MHTAYMLHPYVRCVMEEAGRQEEGRKRAGRGGQEGRSLLDPFLTEDRRREGDGRETGGRRGGGTASEIRADRGVSHLCSL
jgi:hypothetical protein